MADEKLAEQLTKLKATMVKWMEILNNYKTWAMANDGVLDAGEQAQINKLQADIDAIKARIAQIEKAKGINQEPSGSEGFFDSIVDGAKDLVNTVVETGKEIVNTVVDYVTGGKEDGEQEESGTTPVTPTVEPTVETPKKEETTIPVGVPQVGKIPPGFVRMKDKEVTPELSKAAVKYLNEFCAKYPAPVRDKHYGEYIFFRTADGKEFLAHFEVHTVYGADVTKPQVPHPSIGLFKNSANDQVVDGGETTTPETTTPPPVVSTSGEIKGSVGKGGTNTPEDVLLVKKLLNKKINAGLTEDNSNVAGKTIAAIEKFQKEVVGSAKPDGRIDPGGKTWKALSSGGTQVPTDDKPKDETHVDPPKEEETHTEEPIVKPNASLTGQVGLGKINTPGDVAAIQALLNKFGNKFTVDGVFTPALAAAIEKFQKDEAGISKPDGVVDPGGKTWKALNGEKPGAPPAGPMNKPNWVKIAESELGQKEKVGKEHNPRIVEYHSTTGKAKDDETAWCSSFVNWVMNKAGQGGTNSAMAISWAKWGKKVTEPAYGAIAVIDWDGPGPGWKGHVGFVVGKKGSSILLLGGNQSNAVTVSSFGTSKVIAYVYPSNFEIPANFYTFGEAEGDFGGDTDIDSTR